MFRNCAIFDSEEILTTWITTVHLQYVGINFEQPQQTFFDNCTSVTLEIFIISDLKTVHFSYVSNIAQLILHFLVKKGANNNFILIKIYYLTTLNQCIHFRLNATNMQT